MDHIVEIGTILSRRTREGIVEFKLDDTLTQWDLRKAREIHRMLGEAIEAAVSDTLIYQYLVGKIGLDENRAAMALLDFRELRQGSRSTVYPT